MKEQIHKKKTISALCVSAAVILLLLFSMYVVFHDAAFGWFVTLLVEGCHLALIACMCYVVKERVQELKKGYEDDLDNY